MIKQARSTGGLWFRYGGLQGVIDPARGAWRTSAPPSRRLPPTR